MLAANLSSQFPTLSSWFWHHWSSPMIFLLPVHLPFSLPDVSVQPPPLRLRLSSSVSLHPSLHLHLQPESRLFSCAGPLESNHQIPPLNSVHHVQLLLIISCFWTIDTAQDRMIYSFMLLVPIKQEKSTPTDNRPGSVFPTSYRACWSCSTWYVVLLLSPICFKVQHVICPKMLFLIPWL